MDKYMRRRPPQPQQKRKEMADFTKRRPFVEDDRRKEMADFTKRRPSVEDDRRMESADFTKRKPSVEKDRRRKEFADYRKREPLVEDDRRRSATMKKVRLRNDTERASNTEDSKLPSIKKNTEDSKSKSLKVHRSGRTSRSASAGFDSLSTASINANKISPPSSHGKAVNWRLACFMAKEYFTSGTLLGKPWPPQDSNATPRENGEAQPREKLAEDGAANEKETLYASFTTNFLWSDDIHISGICNPSQMADWLGLVSHKSP